MNKARVWAVTSGVVAMMVAVAGCSILPWDRAAGPITEETPSPTASPVDPDESPVYDQSVEWRRCGELECATILVPLDWQDPAGPTITIALNRSQARVPGERLGSLLINPGGPGGSGLDLVEPFLEDAGRRLLDSYDV